jgi:hypothetical protein
MISAKQAIVPTSSCRGPRNLEAPAVQSTEAKAGIQLLEWLPGVLVNVTFKRGEMQSMPVI